MKLVCSAPVTGAAKSSAGRYSAPATRDASGFGYAPGATSGWVNEYARGGRWP